MRYVRRSGFHSKNVGGVWMLLEENKEFVRELNDVAGEIWGYIEKPRTVKQISKYLTTLFEVEAGVVEKDVCDFLREYVKEGFVEEIAI